MTIKVRVPTKEDEQAEGQVEHNRAPNEWFNSNIDQIDNKTQ